MIKDKNFAIFRRFDDLNMLNLMALQAEIIELRNKFRKQYQQDNEESQKYSCSFHSIREAVSLAQGEEPQEAERAKYLRDTQIATLKTLQDRMSRYNTLLLQGELLLPRLSSSRLYSYYLKLIFASLYQVSQLSHVHPPRESQLRELQGWLRDRRGGNNFPQGNEFYTWRKSDADAYVCLKTPNSEGDIFSDFVTYSLPRFFHRLFGEKDEKSGGAGDSDLRSGPKFGRIVDEEAGLTSYSESALGRASGIVTLVISTTLPVLAIFILDLLPDKKTRIGLTVVFTALFATLLAVFSSARRAEIFAATAT
ncbi:hypothetical protein F5Y10DRAFT_264425 [Nemania abortiva]|nr:hypothetical protein F5Y10DRAFT_264425 [Nemania abortiva]